MKYQGITTPCGAGFLGGITPQSSLWDADSDYDIVCRNHQIDSVRPENDVDPKDLYTPCRDGTECAEGTKFDAFGLPALTAFFRFTAVDIKETITVNC